MEASSTADSVQNCGGEDLQLAALFNQALKTRTAKSVCHMMRCGKHRGEFSKRTGRRDEAREIIAYVLCARDMHMYENCALCLGNACIYDRFLISVERGVQRGDSCLG